MKKSLLCAMLMLALTAALCLGGVTLQQDVQSAQAQQTAQITLVATRGQEANITDGAVGGQLNFAFQTSASAASFGEQTGLDDKGNAANLDEHNVNKYTSQILVNDVPLSNHNNGTVGLHRNYGAFAANMVYGDGTPVTIDQNKVWYHLGISISAHAGTVGLKLDGTDVITVKAGLPVSADGSVVLDKDYRFAVTFSDIEPVTRIFTLAADETFTTDTVVDVRGLPSGKVSLPADENHQLPASIELYTANRTKISVPASYAWQYHPTVEDNVANAITADVSAYTFRTGLSVPAAIMFNITVGMDSSLEFVGDAVLHLHNLAGNNAVAFEIEVRFNVEATVTTQSNSGGTISAVADSVKNILINGVSLEQIRAKTAVDYIRHENFQIDWRPNTPNETARTLHIVIPSNLYAIQGVGIKGDGTDTVTFPKGGSSNGFYIPEEVCFAEAKTLTLSAKTATAVITEAAARDELDLTPNGYFGLGVKFDVPALGSKTSVEPQAAYGDNILINGKTVTYINANLTSDQGLKANVHLGYQPFIGGTAFQTDTDLNKLFFHIGIGKDVMVAGQRLFKGDGTDIIVIKQDFPTILDFKLDKNYVYRIKSFALPKEDRGVELLEGNYIVAINRLDGVSDSVVRFGDDHSFTAAGTGIDVFGEEVDMTVTYNWTAADDFFEEIIATFAAPAGYNVLTGMSLNQYYDVSVQDYIVSFGEIADAAEIKVGEDHALATEVTATLASGATKTCAISWSWTTANEAGDIQVTGTINTAGSPLNEGLAGTVTKTVKVNPQPTEDGGCFGSTTASVLWLIAAGAAIMLLSMKKRSSIER